MLQSHPSTGDTYCPGSKNPADIPSRGMTASELLESELWLNGPDWLCTSQNLLEAETATPVLMFR